jgi:hypothetical protein
LQQEASAQTNGLASKKMEVDGEEDVTAPENSVPLDAAAASPRDVLKQMSAIPDNNGFTPFLTACNSLVNFRVCLSQEAL